MLAFSCFVTMHFNGVSDKKRSEECELKGDRGDRQGVVATPCPQQCVSESVTALDFSSFRMAKNVSLSSVNEAFTFSRTDTEMVVEH